MTKSIAIAGALPLLCAALCWPPAAAAQSGDDMLPLLQRPALFGGPNSPEQGLRDRGLGLDVSWTQFAQAMTSPSDGNNRLQSGGKLNAKFAFDFARMGLWEGFSASAIAEYKAGHSVNGFNGVLLPINTQLYEPNGVDSALSLTFTQRFSKEFSLTVGKFNMVDAASGTPIVGGGGINTFWNLNFAAPPSGIVPPYITGLSATYRFAAVNATLMIYDPNDTQDSSGLDGWGQDGINTRLALQFPVRIGDRDGYQTLVGAYSSKDSVDLADVPWLVLPVRPPNTVIDVKRGSWYLGWNFQQYLWQSPDDPARGYGIFGQTFVADGNPNIYRWFANGGVGGSSPLPGRELDRFGVGYFYTSLSQDFTNSLTTLLGYSFGDEQGVEAFYNAAITPWFRVALDLQYIRPGVRDFGNAVFVGLSAHVKL